MSRALDHRRKGWSSGTGCMIEWARGALWGGGDDKGTDAGFFVRVDHKASSHAESNKNECSRAMALSGVRRDGVSGADVAASSLRLSSARRLSYALFCD